MFEVHVFVGRAESAGIDATGYAQGERHAVLLYLRQEQGTDYSAEAAKCWLEQRSSVNAVFTRAAVARETQQTDFAEAYRKALEVGGAAIIYSTPLES
jgi:GTP cyclohydrolase II